METTVEETRAHLGVETSRQWDDKAMARTAPASLTLYSLVTLMGTHLIGTNAMSARTADGMAKRTPPFPTPLPWCADVCGVMDIFRRPGPNLMS
jgi:hypothetical protein